MATKKSLSKISINHEEVTPESVFFFEFTRIFAYTILTSQDICDPDCKIFIVIDWVDRGDNSKRFDAFHNIKEIRKATKKLIGTMFVDISNDEVYHIKTSKGSGPIQQLPSRYGTVSLFEMEFSNEGYTVLKEEVVRERLFKTKGLSSSLKKAIITKAKQSIHFLEIINKLSS